MKKRKTLLEIISNKLKIFKVCIVGEKEKFNIIDDSLDPNCKVSNYCTIKQKTSEYFQMEIHGNKSDYVTLVVKGIFESKRVVKNLKKNNIEIYYFFTEENKRWIKGIKTKEVSLIDQNNYYSID